jgi:hypothetical protein
MRAERIPDERVKNRCEPMTRLEEAFVDWLFCDEATRTPTGKRQTQPLRGAFREYFQGVKMRGSDIRMRRTTAITFLTEVIGMSVEDAASFACERLHESRAMLKRVNTIRADYYQSKRDGDWGTFRLLLGDFAQFVWWAIGLSDEGFDFMGQHIRDDTPALASRIVKLMATIRTTYSGSPEKRDRLGREQRDLMVRVERVQARRTQLVKQDGNLRDQSNR